jgi:hypothetical protein
MKTFNQLIQSNHNLKKCCDKIDFFEHELKALLKEVAYQSYEEARVPNPGYPNQDKYKDVDEYIKLMEQ